MNVILYSLKQKKCSYGAIGATENAGRESDVPSKYENTRHENADVTE